MSSPQQELFPEPTPPLSNLCPAYWPGRNAESTKALQDVLEDNHKRWNIFFNDRGFHNHITHHVLAIWSLGAPAATISAGYKSGEGMQKPAFQSPEAITVDNFNSHLGDKQFYSAYKDFFHDVVLKKGAIPAIEEYVFSPAVNVAPAGEKDPAMLNRFVSGLVHAMIHTGYGVEFNMPGMVIEGLAEAAVTNAGSNELIPSSLFQGGTIGKLTTQLATALNISAKPQTASAGVHAFTIVSRMLDDSRLQDRTLPEVDIYDAVLRRHGAVILDYANQWTLDTTDPKQVQCKIEELQWMNAMLYAIPGFKAGQEFNADFFLMHLVTSSIFLPAFAAKLSPSSLSLLLRSYFTISLAWWVARGRPGLDIEAFFAGDTAHPLPPGEFPKPPRWSLPSAGSPLARAPNPWFSVIDRSILHPDQHLCKIQRALAHFGTLYGTRKAGEKDFSSTGLPGANKLDGTLFIRAAGLTADRLGRNPEGEEYEFWDRGGFFVRD